MQVLRRSVGQAQPAKSSKKPKATSRKEMLLPIDGKKPKEAVQEDDGQSAA